MFVVFEGIDGSGKTTVSNMVAERLRAGGLSIKHLRAEGKFVSVVSEAIRELGRDARNIELVPQAEFLLYVARDVQLIEQALRPALGQTDVVLADRFLYTAEILGRHGRRLSLEWMTPVLQAAAGGLVPDLVVLVDVDPVLARARRKAAKLAADDQRPPSRKGLAGVGLQHRMRRGYLELAASSPERWVIVDNEDLLEDSVNRVTELILDAHRGGVASALANFRAAGKRSARPAQPLTSPDQALEAFLQWVDLRSEREPRVAAYLLGGLFGAGVDDRRRALADRVPQAVLAGLSGLGDDVSWELREKLQREHPRAVAQTLGGFLGSHARAKALRRALEGEAPIEVVTSVGRLDDDFAWQVRERLYEKYPAAVVGSLAMLGSDRAWNMRQRWLDRANGQLGQSYETARVGAKSVTGLDDERSWNVRREVRTSAPVAALASLEGVVGTRSWEWRSEFLSRAPKVVMLTLKRLSHPRAWQMRDAVAGDCKEAIDSIAWLDDAEAWDMRDTHADTWPSTVVKTLGPLSDGARGRELIARQLRNYPGNVSLLKHAAAVALGTHRVGSPDDY
ncbi:MAG TPA: dTMP kinase [Polyangiaceae bacterium]|nr:dTMP kinase [Polyangiaceae bacterium]